MNKQLIVVTKLLCGILLLAVLGIAFDQDVEASTDGSTGGSDQADYRPCKAPFALCSASTCKEVPGTMEVVGKNSSGDPVVDLYPRAECQCEVISEGEGMADLDMMGGSCDAPIIKKSAKENKEGIWSLYSNKYEDQMMKCPGSAERFAQCFSYACVYDETDPDKAICTCPIEFGAFSSAAGDCDSDNCSDQLLVGGPAWVPTGKNCSGSDAGR